MPLASKVSRLHIHPSMFPELISDTRFPNTATMQQRTETRTGIGGITYEWNDVPGYVAIPCATTNQVLKEMRAAVAETRTASTIQELEYWDVMLAGIYDGISPDWRCVLDTGRILDIMIAADDALQVSTVLTCRTISPTAEPGV